MVWALIRSSPAWRVAAWASLIYAAGWLVLSQGIDRGQPAAAPVLVYMCHMIAVSRAPETAFRCTFFDAALPVQGRQLWVSKMVVLLGSLWLPVLAASAVGFAKHNPVLPFLNAAAGYTVILLFAQNFRIREFHEPILVCVISLLVGLSVMTLLTLALPDSGMRMLAGYLVSSAALFLISWTRVPKSFQAAPMEPAPAKPTQTTSSAGAPRPILVWWKILRQIYGWQILVMAPFVWVSGASALLGLLSFALPVAAIGNINRLFLAHLPVSLRKLFCAVWAPLPLAILLGYEAATHFPLGRSIRPVVLEPRIMTIALAMNVALFLSWVACLQSWDWYRLRSLPIALRAVLVAALPVFVAAAWILTPSNEAWWYGSDPIPYYAVRLAAVVPENPLLLAATLVIPLVGLYWLAERTFCEREYPTVRRSSAEGYLVRELL